MSNWCGWFTDNGAILGWLGAVSLVMFVGTLLVTPILVSRIPADYFVDKTRHASKSKKMHPVIHALAIAAKNILGIILVIAGIMMLVLPGQGLLTILIGVLMMDFPGKYKFERKVVAQPAIFNAINWIRDRRGDPPLMRPGVN